MLFDIFINGYLHQIESNQLLVKLSHYAISSLGGCPGGRVYFEPDQKLKGELQPWQDVTINSGFRFVVQERER